MKEAQENKDLICKALRHNELTYGRMCYHNGLQWIDRYFETNETMQEVMQRSTMFWAWWKQQWALRDAQFIYETSLSKVALPLEGDFMLVALDLYYDIHKVKDLKIVPNRFVIAEVNQILNEIIKEQQIKFKTTVHELHSR